MEIVVATGINMAAIALGCAAAALGYGHAVLSEAWHLKVKDLLTLIELVLLTAIGILVLADRTLHWHRRWLDYRMLAELLRPMPYLALVAATASADTVGQSGTMRPDPRGRVDGPGAKRGPAVGGWVFAQFEAILRHAGLPSASQSPSYLADCRSFVMTNLLADQIRYHEGTAIRNAGLEHRLMLASTGLFIATLLVVALKFGLGLGGFETTWLGFLAAFLPAAAAACYGIRSHAELDIVARRSEDMVERLKWIRHQLKRVSDEKISADAIAAGVCRAAEIMVRDAVGWQNIFEAKEPEPA